jgi:hypothetical protein
LWGFLNLQTHKNIRIPITLCYIWALKWCIFKNQSHSLLGRLEGLGRGVTAAMGRRKEALELERVWLRERKATALSLRNGFNILRRGFAKLD